MFQYQKMYKCMVKIIKLIDIFIFNVVELTRITVD